MFFSQSGKARRGGGALVAVIAVVSLSSVGGCKKKDAEKCSQAQQVTRQAISAEDFDLARQWREYAYKHCEDGTVLAALDQEIVAQQEQIKKREAAEKAAEQRRKQLAGLFGQWAGGAQSNATKAGSNVTCEKEDDDAAKKSKERWCVATRQVQGVSQPFKARYWEKEPDSALFWMAPDQPVSCADLGGHTVMSQWDVPAVGGQTVKRMRCEMTAGPMAGLQVILTDATNSGVYAFTKKYQEKDPKIRGKVQ